MFFSRSLFSCLPGLQLAGNAEEQCDVRCLFGTLLTMPTRNSPAGVQVRGVAGDTGGNPRSGRESVFRPVKETTEESPAVFKRAE